MKSSLIKNLNYLSKPVLLFTTIFWTLGASASNNYPVSFFWCNGYEPIKGLYWKIEGEISNTTNPLKNMDDSYIYSVSLSSAATTIVRNAIGRKTSNRFILSFYKNNDPTYIKNIKGIFNVENTEIFPSSTRFAAHGWLASNPHVSNGAIDFICTLN